MARQSSHETGGAGTAAAVGLELCPAPRFWPAVVGILLLTLFFRIAILDEYLRQNPIAHAPWSDGQVYWEEAGRIAGGTWLPATPFLSAPLYPYFLAVIRACGGGLTAVYAVQIGLHLATGLLIAIVARRRWGAWAGVAAQALFVALSEPSVSSMRILGNTLQVFIVAVICWRWSALAERRAAGADGWTDTAAVGGLIGLLSLTYPSALLLAPLFSGWVWWQGGRRLRAAGRAVCGLVVAGALIALPTIHNHRATGDWILISAHGGITLRQGNGPASKGIFTYVRDIDPDRRQMHDSAAAVFAAKYGRPGSWAEVDAHFRREVLAFWRENSLATVVLFGRKLFWFLSSVNYDDIAPLPLEREAGLASRSWLAPLPTAWLLGLAAVGLMMLIRSRRVIAPELCLLLLPLITVLLFFYTPRYRLPAVPVLCGLAGAAVAGASTRRIPWAMSGVVTATPILLTIISFAVDYDTVAKWRKAYRAALLPALADLGDGRLEAGDWAGAVQAYEAAGALDPRFARAKRRMGVIWTRRGDPTRAEQAFRAALATDPADTHAHRHLYNLLVAHGRYSDAADALRSLIPLEPQAAEPRLYLAWLLATCPDERVRRPAEAVRLAEAACLLPNPDDSAAALHVLAATLAAVGRFDDAIATASESVERWRRRGGAVGTGDSPEGSLEVYRGGQALTASPMLFPGY